MAPLMTRPSRWERISRRCLGCSLMAAWRIASACVADVTACGVVAVIGLLLLVLVLALAHDLRAAHLQQCHLGPAQQPDADVRAGIAGTHAHVGAVRPEHLD